MQHFKQLLYVVALLLSSWSAAILAAPANGIWTTSTGDYFLLMQDSANARAIAVQVAYDLTSASVFVGTENANTLTLGKLDQSATLTATATGNTMSGSYVQSGGASDAFSANLTYTFEGSDYDGVWQKTGANSYLAYLSVYVQGKSVTVVLDITLNSDNTLSYDVLTGTLAGNVYTGVSAMNGRLLKLTFSGANADGAYVTASRQTTKFTAAQICKVN